jgi:hypothetical protein
LSRERLALGLLLLVPTLLLQLRLPVPRLDADAVEYYSHLRSLYFDRDVDFANEFEHFGILARGDKVQPTKTGHRRTIFSVGPALLWMPFYAAGDVVARVGGGVEDGYSPAHIRAVTLGSLCYAIVGLLLLNPLLRELAGRTAAFLTTLLLLYATFLYWYVVHEPVMSHAGSFFLSAVVLRVFWTGREAPGDARCAALGLLIGLAACVRWQNAVLLLLPAATLARQLRPAPLDAVRRGLLTLAAFALGALPQMLAWKAIFGEYLLADPPHGRDFLRLGHPYLLETFFSSRHGLLYWTPLLWAGFLGYAGLVRRRPFVALATGLPLLVMTYVNVCSGDWWAGGSFSNRRFDSALPMLALGLAVSIEALLRWSRRHPAAGIVAGLAALTLWNGLFMEQYRRNLVPRDSVVSFGGVVENGAALLSQAVGTPLAWPANWVFAAQHDALVASYDLAVGKYLFYRQNNLGGVIDLGDERADPALLLEGWARVRPCGREQCRAIEGSARLLVPLDVPEDLELTVRAEGEGFLSVWINGHELASLPLSETLEERRARVPAAWLHREANELRLGASAGTAIVDRVTFRRTSR